jgi:hypothetical protein
MLSMFAGLMSATRLTASSSAAVNAAAEIVPRPLAMRSLE